jgi:hypothetical protein
MSDRGAGAGRRRSAKADPVPEDDTRERAEYERTKTEKQLADREEQAKRALTRIAPALVSYKLPQRSTL